MESDVVTLSALQFLCGESEHICRLCFASTGSQEVNIEDNVKLQTSYYENTVSFTSMFTELGVSIENLLPQVLCNSCAKSIINSYLLNKLIQFSYIKWKAVLQQLDKSLSNSHVISPTVKSIYLIINRNENIMFTSRKTCSAKRSKKIAVAKMKEIINVRRKYTKLKQVPKDTICEECGERFNTTYLLVKHMKIHNKYMQPCPQCPKAFLTRAQLSEHTERIHYPKHLKCPTCEKMFSTDRVLNIHIKQNHIPGVCNICYKNFPSKKLLRAHMDKHETHSCPKCNKNFSSKPTFKQHFKLCGRLDSRTLNFFCDICNKGYIRKNSLRTHLKTDHGFGNVISCEWCGKKFDAASRLKSHIVKHTKEKNFHCLQCGGKFVTHAALVYHTRLHTGEKPFPCDECDLSFLSASRRMEHKRRKHIGPTHECPICQVKFVVKRLLHKHIQRHYNPHSKLYVAYLEQTANENVLS